MFCGCNCNCQHTLSSLTLRQPCNTSNATVPLSAGISWLQWNYVFYRCPFLLPCRLSCMDASHWFHWIRHLAPLTLPREVRFSTSGEYVISTLRADSLVILSHRPITFQACLHCTQATYPQEVTLSIETLVLGLRWRHCRHYAAVQVSQEPASVTSRDSQRHEGDLT